MLSIVVRSAHLKLFSIWHHHTERCVWALDGVYGLCRDRAKQLEEEIIAEGRAKAHKEAEPSNGKAPEREDRHRRDDEHKHDSSRRRRERSESPDWDRHRDDRKRRQRHSRSRSPDRHR